MSGWRTALRVARRSVRRNLGRSLLIIALVALPVAAATVADGVVRTLTDRETDLKQFMGTADVKINLNVPHGYDFDVEQALPPGSRVVPLWPPTYAGSLRLSVGDRIVRTSLRPVVLGDPLTAHLARLSAGRLPKTPGEALVTAPLAEKLGLLDEDGGLRPHATIGAASGPRVTVTGLAIEPFCLTCAEVVANPDTLIAKASPQGGLGRSIAFLVDLPPGTDVTSLVGGWDWDRASLGTRDSFQDHTPFSDYVTATVTQPILLFVGLALLGIVITAGAAFAVGARRQMRELGLVAVNGGTAKHVRRIVLAQGLVLGVLGAATGLVVGAAVMVLGVPLWQRVTGQLMESPRFGWGELAAAAVVGILASVVASVVPAFSVARTQPADALAGRLHRDPPRARVRLLGVGLVLAGTAAVVVAVVVSRGRLADHEARVEQYGSAPPLDRTLPLAGTLLGVLLGVLGLILVMPAVLTAAGRLGNLLPLSGRLAVRDAVRHRHRTIAAGAAIMITVMCSVVTAFVFTSRSANEAKTLPPNTVLVSRDASSLRAEAEGEFDLAAAKAREAVPGTVTRPVTLVGNELDDDPKSNSMLPLYLEPGDEYVSCTSAMQVGIGTPELIELATGRAPDAGVLAALAEGKAVSYDKCAVSSSGTVKVQPWAPNPVSLAGHLARPAPGTDSYVGLPSVFISPETAAAHGWSTYMDTMAITYPAPADLDAIRTAAENAGVDLYIPDESSGGYVTSLYYLLAALAGVVAFLGAGVTVALAATDGRPDLATLAALGASGYRRRTLAGAHALVVTMLGTLSGLTIGAGAAFAAVPIMSMDSVVVPWQHLLITTLAVPLLATAVAVLVTPSRLPLARRS